jgi:hypothetical protein
MLAFAGTVACGDKDPTGPRSPDLAAPAKQWTVPTVASLITQWEADLTRTEVEAMRVSNNQVVWQSYLEAPLVASQDQWFPAPTAAPPPPPPPGGGCTSTMSTGTKGSVGINMIACSVVMSGYVPPATRMLGGKENFAPPGRMLGRSPAKPKFLFDNGWSCKDLHDQMIYQAKRFSEAYYEFWGNLLTPPFVLAPLNWFLGGPVDRMRASTRQMGFIYGAYRSNGCVTPRTSPTPIP